MVRQRLTPQPFRLLKRHRAPALPISKPSLCSAFSWALYTRLQAYVVLRCGLHLARPTSHELKVRARLLVLRSRNSGVQKAALFALIYLRTVWRKLLTTLQRGLRLALQPCYMVSSCQQASAWMRR